MRLFAGLVWRSKPIDLWGNQFGGLKAGDAKELRRLRDENQRLTKLLAEAELQKLMLEASWLRETFEPGSGPSGC